MMVREGPPQWQNPLTYYIIQLSHLAAVEHEAWARGTRGPELKDQDQDQGARTRGLAEPSSRSRRQDRDPDKNRHRAPRLENNQVQKGRDLGMTTDQTNGQRQVKGRKKLKLLSEKINPLYMPQRNAIL